MVLVGDIKSAGIVSTLIKNKVDVSSIKDILLDHYLEVLKEHIEFDKIEWVKYYRAFVLVRLMQAMGAYGFRGFYERRTQFLKSIPYALKQLDSIIKFNLLP